MEVRHILHKFATMDYDDNDSGDWYGNTASPDDMMWTDYDYHQNTGELGDLFDDEDNEDGGDDEDGGGEADEDDDGKDSGILPVLVPLASLSVRKAKGVAARAAVAVKADAKGSAAADAQPAGTQPGRKGKRKLTKAGKVTLVVSLIVFVIEMACLCYYCSGLLFPRF